MKTKALISLVVIPMLLALSGCPAMRRGGGGGGGGSGSGSGSGGSTIAATCRGDFGANAAAQKIEAFLLAVAEFSDSALAIENDLLGACQRMGRALGMPEAELAGRGSDAVRTVCSAVQQRYQSETQAIRAATSVEVRTEVQPPHCEVSVTAYTDCIAECEVEIDPGSVEITCEGGEIRGRCSAQCTGSCAVEASGVCSGTCEGACEGTCSARAADGSCAGTCDGACRGQCVVRAQASCTGECRGGCTVEYQEPYCTGTVRPARASARCRASCDARVEARARCTPGEYRMSVSGSVDPAMQPRIDAVQRANREGLSAILAIRVRAQRLQASAREIVRIAPELPSAAAAVGLGAAACATQAAGATAGAMASVSVSVEVSVSVSASASAR